MGVIGCLYAAHDELNQSVSVIFERVDLLSKGDSLVHGPLAFVLRDGINGVS